MIQIVHFISHLMVQNGIWVKVWNIQIFFSLILKVKLPHTLWTKLESSDHSGLVYFLLRSWWDFHDITWSDHAYKLGLQFHATLSKVGLAHTAAIEYSKKRRIERRRFQSKAYFPHPHNGMTNFLNQDSSLLAIKFRV